MIFTANWTILISMYSPIFKYIIYYGVNQMDLCQDRMWKLITVMKIIPANVEEYSPVDENIVILSRCC